MAIQPKILKRLTVRRHVRTVIKEVLKTKLKGPNPPFPWNAKVNAKLKGPNVPNWSIKQLAMVNKLKAMRPQYSGLEQGPADAVNTFDKPFSKTTDLYTDRLMALQQTGGGS